MLALCWRSACAVHAQCRCSARASVDAVLLRCRCRASAVLVQCLCSACAVLAQCRVIEQVSVLRFCGAGAQEHGPAPGPDTKHTRMASESRFASPLISFSGQKSRASPGELPEPPDPRSLVLQARSLASKVRRLVSRPRSPAMSTHTPTSEKAPGATSARNRSN